MIIEDLFQHHEKDALARSTLAELHLNPSMITLNQSGEILFATMPIIARLDIFPMALPVVINKGNSSNCPELRSGKFCKQGNLIIPSNHNWLCVYVGQEEFW